MGTGDRQRKRYFSDGKCLPVWQAVWGLQTDCYTFGKYSSLFFDSFWDNVYNICVGIFFYNLWEGWGMR